MTCNLIYHSTNIAFFAKIRKREPENQCVKYTYIRILREIRHKMRRSHKGGKPRVNTRDIPNRSIMIGLLLSENFAAHEKPHPPRNIRVRTRSFLEIGTLFSPTKKNRTKKHNNTSPGKFTISMTSILCDPN